MDILDDNSAQDTGDGGKAISAALTGMGAAIGSWWGGGAADKATTSSSTASGDATEVANEEEVEEEEEEEEEEADGGEDGGMDRVLRSEGTRRPVERLAAVDWRKREEAEVEAPPAAEEGAVRKRPIGLSTLVDDPNYEASESEEEVPVEAEEEKEEEEEERPRPPLPLENERLDLGTIQVRAHVPPPAELSCSPRRDL